MCTQILHLDDILNHILLLGKIKNSKYFYLKGSVYSEQLGDCPKHPSSVCSLCGMRENEGDKDCLMWGTDRGDQSDKGTHW